MQNNGIPHVSDLQQLGVSWILRGGGADGRIVADVRMACGAGCEFELEPAMAGSSVDEIVSSALTLAMGGGAAGRFWQLKSAVMDPFGVGRAIVESVRGRGAVVELRRKPAVSCLSRLAREDWDLLRASLTYAHQCLGGLSFEGGVFALQIRQMMLESFTEAARTYRKRTEGEKLALEVFGYWLESQALQEWRLHWVPAFCQEL